MTNIVKCSNSLFCNFNSLFILLFSSIFNILFILITATISRFERINSRLLSPVIIPLILSCTCWILEIIKNSKRLIKYAIVTTSIILMLIFSYSIYQIDWQRYDDEKDYGVPGYSDDDWNKSEFVSYLKNNKKKHILYINKTFIYR